MILRGRRVELCRNVSLYISIRSRLLFCREKCDRRYINLVLLDDMARRMDISSLLCQADSPPSPVNDPVILAPHLRGRHARPPPTTTTTTDHRMSHHSIDALLHHPHGRPPSLASLLNHTPASDHTPRLSATPSEPSSMHHQRSPFSGFDALVHAASEERRRINRPPAMATERDPWREDEQPAGNIVQTPSTSPLHDRPSSRRHSHPFTLPPPQPLLHSPLYSPSLSQQVYPSHTNTLQDQDRPLKRRRPAYSPPRSQSPSRSRSSSDPVTASLPGATRHPIPSVQSLSPNSAHTRRHVELISQSPSTPVWSSRMAPVADDRSDSRVPVDVSFPLPPLFLPGCTPTSPSQTTPQLHPHISTYVQNQPHNPLHAAVSGRHSPMQHSPRHPSHPSPDYSHSPHKHFQHLCHPQAAHPIVYEPPQSAPMSPSHGDSHHTVGTADSLGLELPTGKLLMREESTEGLKYHSRQQEGGEKLQEELSREHSVQVQPPAPRLTGAGRQDEDKGLSVSSMEMQSSMEWGITTPVQSNAQPPPLPKSSRKRKSEDRDVRSRPDSQSQTLSQHERPLQTANAPRHVSPTPLERASGNEYAMEGEAVGTTKRNTKEEDMEMEVHEVIGEGDVVLSPSPAPSPPRPVTPPVRSSSTERPPSVFLTQDAPKRTLVPADNPTHPSQALLTAASPKIESRPSPSTPVPPSPSIKIEPELPTTDLSSPQPLSPRRTREREVLPPLPAITSPEGQLALNLGSRPGTPQSTPGQHASHVVQSKVEEESSVVSNGVILSGPPDGESEAISDSPQEIVPEIQPKLKPIPSPPEIRSPSPSNVCLTKEETKLIPHDAPIPELHSSLPLAEPLHSREPESDLELTQQQLSTMDIDEELLSLVEDTVPRSSPASVPSQTFKTSAKSVSPLASQAPARPRSPAILMEEEKDRASMPPPAPRTKKGDKEKAATIAGGSKKKDGTSKPSTKHKQPMKSRAKPPPKTKAKSNDVPSQKDAAPKGALSLKTGVNPNARSRSTSVIPVGDEAAEADDSEKEDDKLYCVCKTQYDEDKMMIACDRCDEWYHTQCVRVSDLEIDLVDQFICPPCIQNLPHLHTTWKRRCLFGLKHDNPGSPSACHKPSRGAFSKYCSDECGVKYMQSRIAHWEKSGGNRDLLWETVKGAEKRQGVVVRIDSKSLSEDGALQHRDTVKQVPDPIDAAARRKAEREIARLNARLAQVVKEREITKGEMDMVLWREKVVDLASKRAERVDECGWDQRLCFGEEEWVDFGAEVLESYEEEKGRAESGDEDTAAVSIGEWWCTGKKRCDRHAGWQKLRTAEVLFEKEMKEGLLLNLTTREREIRKGIEDILYPQSSTAAQAPRTAARLEVQLNGSDQSRTNGDILEREKKKKS